VPKGWVWCELGKTAFLKAGSFVKADNICKKYHSHLFPCYGGNGLRGYVQTYTHEGLYSLIGRQGALCGNVNLAEGKFHATEHAIVTSPYGNINSLWMFYVLKAINLNQYSIGAAQPGLSVERINKVLCPLPPLSEQQCIVSVIESAFVLIDEIEVDKLSLEQFIKQAKAKTLDLAIRGKLVPQNPNDEPASVLLERSKSGQKIKKLTADISHYPFEVPEGWAWCRLGEIGNWSAGTTPSRLNKKYYENATIPWLKTGDLNDNIITSVSEYISKYALCECKQLKLNSVGTVAIALYGATIGRCGILDLETTTNQACCVCKTHPIVFNKYLFYFLLSHREQFKEQAEGGAQPNISKDKIVNSLIPLPPLPEQKRIVQRIEIIFQTLDSIQNNL
jgi:type I restriction enzyme S subunit